MQRHEMILYRALFICIAVIFTASMVYIDQNIRGETKPVGLTYDIGSDSDDSPDETETPDQTVRPLLELDGISAVDAAYGVAYIENTNQIFIDRRIWDIQTEDCDIESNDDLLYIITLNVGKSGSNRYKPVDGRYLQSYTFDGLAGELRLQAKSSLTIETVFTDDYILLTMQTLRDKYDRIVYIDAGHGGYDDGAVKAGIREKNVNLKIALFLYDLLIENLETTGIYPILSRTEDIFIERKDRGLEGSRLADLIVSVHCNTYDKSENVNGTEVHYKPNQQLDDSSRTNLNSTELGRIMVDSVCESTGSKNRGMFERDDLGILNAATVPCVIVETGYLTNPAERALLIDEDYQKKIVDGLYTGIVKAFSR